MSGLVYAILALTGLMALIMAADMVPLRRSAPNKLAEATRSYALLALVEPYSPAIPKRVVERNPFTGACVHGFTGECARCDRNRA